VPSVTGSFAGRQILRFQADDGLTPTYARLVAPTLGEVFSPAVEKSVLESKHDGQCPISGVKRTLSAFDPVVIQVRLAFLQHASCEFIQSCADFFIDSNRCSKRDEKECRASRPAKARALSWHSTARRSSVGSLSETASGAASHMG
jgi:hypothetical protein